MTARREGISDIMPKASATHSSAKAVRTDTRIPRSLTGSKNTSSAAVVRTMFAGQQMQRASFGDEDDYTATKQEIQSVVSQVSEVIEKNLDEDLLERLDRGEYPRFAGVLSSWPRLRAVGATWPYWNYNLYGQRFWTRPGRRTWRAHGMLDEILEEAFAGLRRAHRTVTEKS